MNNSAIPQNWTKEQLSSYLSAVNSYYAVDDKVSFAISIIITITCIIGFIGYFVELLVLRNPVFNDPGFLYHKILAVCEILLLITFPMMSANGLIPTKWQSFLSLYMAKVANPALSNFFALTIYTLIVGMAFNRYCAVVHSRSFNRINKPKFPFAFLVAGLIQGTVGLLFFFIFDVEYLTTCKCYILVLTTYFDPIFKPMFVTGISLEVINSAANAFFTVMIIWGFSRKAKGIQEWQSSAKVVEEKAKTLQLTILCLACSIPFLVSFVFAAIPYFFPDFVVGTDALVLPYAEAEKQLQTAYAYTFYNLAHETWYDLTHSTHFYMYMILNKRFRAAARNELAQLLRIN